MKPLMEQAKKEYPEEDGFYQWFDDRWKDIVEHKLVQGSCGCKGCKE
jgi:hypothetical protein